MGCYSRALCLLGDGAKASPVGWNSSGSARAHNDRWCKRMLDACMGVWVLLGGAPVHVWAMICIVLLQVDWGNQAIKVIPFCVWKK